MGAVVASRRADALRVDPTPFMVWGRAGVLGAIALGTGTVSHVLGEGRLPGPVAMTALLGVCVGLAALFLRARAGVVRLVLLVVAGQTFVHTALSILAGHHGDAAPLRAVAPAADGTRPSRYFDQYDALVAANPAPQGGNDWLAHQIEHVTEQGPAMLLAHVAGAVVLGIFLAVGESALWRLLLLGAARACLRARRSRLAAATLGVRLAGATRRAALAVPTVPFLRPALLDRRPERHRGPPFVLAA